MVQFEVDWRDFFQESNKCHILHLIVVEKSDVREMLIVRHHNTKEPDKGTAS